MSVWRYIVRMVGSEAESTVVDTGAKRVDTAVKRR